MITIDTLALTVSALTALVGLFIAYQAYRGYRRNDSETMRALAIGVVFIAVVPFIVFHPVDTLVGFTDAQALVAGLVSHIIGLLAVYHSFD